MEKEAPVTTPPDVNLPTLDLVLLIDATGSMSATLDALRPVLVQMCHLLPLFAVKRETRFHLAIYRDFDCKDEKVYKYHGPFDAMDSAKMAQIIAATSAEGGDDTAECQKYAMNRLLEDLPASDGKAIIFHFTDAPPHKLPFPNAGRDNHYKEGYKLKMNEMEPDWGLLCRKYAARDISVYTIGQLQAESHVFYSLLAHITHAELVILKNARADTILKATTMLIPRALGYDECDLMGLASLVRIADNIDTSDIKEVNNGLSTLKTAIIEFLEGQAPELCSARKMGFSEVRKVADVCNRIKLEQRYKSDPSFQELCFTTFDYLINNGHILALTYNPLLGCLYRNMCRRSKLSQTEARRDKLNVNMSTAMGKLKTSNNVVYEEVAKWIENSYNRIDEINELMMSIDGPLIPFLTLQTDARLTKKELSLACKIPLPPNLSMLWKMVSSIVLNDKKPKTMPEVFLPLSLPDSDLFSLLSHLMCPGVKLDFKPAVVVALVTLNSGNSILSGRSLNFLRASKGKWYDKDASEWYLYGIIKIILNLEKRYCGILKDDEKTYLECLFKLAAIKYNNFEIDCIRKFVLAPVHKKKYDDHKVQCNGCKQFRSISIMTDKGCGLCLGYSDEKLAELLDDDNRASYLFDCVTCKCRYAVRNIDGLKTKPRCYYCRRVPPTPIENIPKVICETCGVGLILPHNELLPFPVVAGNANKYMCSLCSSNDGIARTEILKVRLHDLITENPPILTPLLGLQVDAGQLLSRESLFALKGKFEVVDKVDIKNAELPATLTHESRPILNTSDILARMRDVVTTGRISTDSCLICYRDAIHHELESPCHYKDCQAMACRICIQTWFSSNEPGRRILENRTTCPCCKRPPLAGLAFTSPHLKILLSQIKKGLDHDWHYAWCKSCRKVKEYMERQCAGPDPMDVVGFTCEDCMNPGIHKACPFCGIPSVKDSGCDHMECPKTHGGCGIHWCYRCEKDVYHADNARDVYNHLNDVHGNIWGAE